MLTKVFPPKYTDLPEYWHIGTLLDKVKAIWLRAYQQCEPVLKTLQGFVKWFYSQFYAVTTPSMTRRSGRS